MSRFGATSGCKPGLGYGTEPPPFGTATLPRNDARGQAAELPLVVLIPHRRANQGSVQVASTSQRSSGLADRYAKALFGLAVDARKLDAVVTDLDGFARMIDSSDDLQRMIRSPVMARRDTVKAVTALAGRAGMDDLTTRFLGMVADNRRLFALPRMIAAFRDLVAAERGETSAEVISAAELKPDTKRAVADAITKAVGGAVVIDARVDPRLLGGLVVKVGSRMIDSSLASKLQRLGLAMKGIG